MHFNLSGKKDKPKEFASKPKSQNDIPLSGTCTHDTLIRATFKGEFTDDEVRVYLCTNPQCGRPVLVSPVSKFKSNPEALAFFREMSKQLELDLPSLTQKYIKDAPEVKTFSSS